MPTAQIIVTSCSRRSLELEQVKNFLRGNGYMLISDDWRVDQRADIILLSTCGFTQAAEDFGFETLRRIEQTKRADAHIIFGGCIPEINPARTTREFGGPTFSPQAYSRLDTILQAKHTFNEFPRPNTFDGVSLTGDMRKAMDIIKTFDGSWSGLQYIARRLSNGTRRRVIRARFANLNNQATYYIQIQEGCSMKCSYCAIRQAIGALRSKPVERVLEEFEAGLSRGYKHFQLVGDNAGSYGLDIGLNMGQLLERVAAIDGEFDLDLTDINPVYLPGIFEPVKRLCAQHRLARLYVPIQSGSRRILKRMNRDCDMADMKRLLIDIKHSVPPPFKLGTSLVVGFPGETQQDIDDTIDYCREVGFDWVWCHSFSARPDTPAATLAEALPAEEIHRRAQYVKMQLHRSLVTTADNTRGSKTCQG